jgi:hypothetical protein
MSASGLAFVDCNLTLGPWASPVLGNELSVAAALAEMDRVGIDAALARHTFGRQLDWRLGNDTLLNELRDVRRIRPVVALFPPMTSADDAELPGYVEQLCRGGAVAAQLHPNPTLDIMDSAQHPAHYFFGVDVVASVCVELVRAGLPLLIDLNEVSWEALWAVCTAFPDLAIVVQNVSYTHKRNVFAALRALPNLHLEISGYHVHQGLDEVCTEFGPDRLLFGSRLPVYEPVSAMGMVLYADGPAEWRRAIAGGNIRRLCAQSWALD